MTCHSIDILFGQSQGGSGDWVGVLSIVVLLGLAVAVVVTLIGVVAAAQHKRWGVVVAVPVVLVGAAMMVMMRGTPNLMWVNAPHIPPVPVMPAIPAAPDAPIVSALPKVLIAASVSVTNDELEDVADAPPKIDLDDVEVHVKSSEDSSRPEWVDAPGKPDRFALTTDPYTSAEACNDAANLQLASALRERAGIDVQHLGDDPASATKELVKRFVKERFLEKREVSVGEVYLMHTLIEVDDESLAWLAEQSGQWERVARQQAGVRTVAIGGSSVLVAMALLHGWLRRGVPS